VPSYQFHAHIRYTQKCVKIRTCCLLMLRFCGFEDAVSNTDSPKANSSDQVERKLKPAFSSPLNMLTLPSLCLSAYTTTDLDKLAAIPSPSRIYLPILIQQAWVSCFTEQWDSACWIHWSDCASTQWKGWGTLKIPGSLNEIGTEFSWNGSQSLWLFFFHDMSISLPFANTFSPHFAVTLRSVNYTR
jgi:hypothetical protein